VGYSFVSKKVHWFSVSSFLSFLLFTSCLAMHSVGSFFFLSFFLSFFFLIRSFRGILQKRKEKEPNIWILN